MSDDVPSRRTFDSIFSEARAGTRMAPEDREVREAMSRIGMTPDGRILSEYLAKTTLFATLPMDASDGAFRSLNAERRVLTRILAALNGELSDDRNDTDGNFRGRVLRRLGGIGSVVRRHLGSGE